jgi:glycosyltransferase involved in cell wall biosynthesis
MREYLPNLLKKKIIKDLPPGMSVPNNFNDQLLSMESPIRYIYVGGIGNYYRMGVLFQAIRYFPNMEYFFCFRKDEWEKGEKIYNIKDMKNILIFHYSNAKLPELYTLCHIGLIFIEPDAYRKFAIPYKLFEYLSYGKPVVASKGTAAGDFVQKWNVGWVIPYEIDALIALFARLSENREEINICKKNIALILADNMWDARISRVKYDLSE